MSEPAEFSKQDKSLLTHLVAESEWNDAGAEYAPASFADEGFIHMSYPWQIAGVQARYYAGRSDMVGLEIDRDELIAAVGHEAFKEERSPSTGDLFPHLYVRLPTYLVKRVVKLS